MAGEYYLDYHIPLELAKLVQELQEGTNTSGTTKATAKREWFSQPRTSGDPTIEVITTTFKLPMSISHVSLEITRMSSKTELWYQDRQNNWRQLLDRDRMPLSVTVSTASLASWYTYSSDVYPVVAKAFQIRVQRVADVGLQGLPYSIGIRNTLIKRNVHTRDQATQAFEDEQDVLGNVVTKYIKDWAPNFAIDNNAVSHWRSGPMPTPSAVVSMYIDMRDENGGPSMMDSLYLDPLYFGQNLNLYYSSDDTVTDLRVSSLSVIPDVTEEVEWNQTVGLQDGTHPSQYLFPFAHGPQREQDAWFGLAWRPSFAADASDAPALNPVLMGVTPSAYVTGVFAPTLTYNVGLRRLELSFFDGTTEVDAYSSSLSFKAGDELRIAVGWVYENGQRRVMLSVRDTKGNYLALTEGEHVGIPTVISFDGQAGLRNFKGLVTAMVVKLESWRDNAPRFSSSPISYCSPDPVLPDANGNIPSTTLDNSIFSVDWTTQQFGMGGMDSSFYTGKTWTPIWRDYISQKGTIVLPQPITAKFLKLEFSNLTPEPYPIFETGIEVKYQVFPITVEQEASISVSVGGTASIEGGVVSGGFGAVVNGKAVNWLDLGSVLDAAKAILMPTGKEVVVQAGPGYVTSALPHTADKLIRGDFDLEVSGSATYSREAMNSLVTTAGHLLTSMLEPYAPGVSQLPIPWDVLASFIPNSVSFGLNLGDGKNDATPVRAEDYWMFPGQMLQLPAEVMQGLAGLSASISGRASYNNRLRFTTTSVHRYEYKTLARSEAIAYFAGLREVVPMMTSYIDTADHDRWEFTSYVPAQWSKQNVEFLSNGLVARAAGSAQPGTLSKTLATTTAFSRVHLEARDTGLIRSDALWASETSDQLAPGAKRYPESIPGASWGDTFAEWGDTVEPWGSPRGQVMISLDGDRSYQGRRVIKISRLALAGEGGISLRQSTNLTAGVMFRLGCVVYKPSDNDNWIRLELLHNPTETVLHTELVPVVAGQWFEWQSRFAEFKGDLSDDYSLRLTVGGDKAEDVYLSDLYTEIAGVRYMVKLGALSQPTIDVTELVYRNSAYATTSVPATSCTVTTVIVSPQAYASGLTLTPTYVR